MMVPAAAICALVRRKTDSSGSVAVSVTIEPATVTLPVVVYVARFVDRSTRKVNRVTKSITVPAFFTPGAATLTALLSVDADDDPYTMLPPDSSAPDTKFR